jgi:hypothetical protein
VTDGSVPVRWGPPPPGPASRFGAWLRSIAGAKPDTVQRLADLPVALRQAPLAAPYLEAEREGDQRRAGTSAMAAAEAGIASQAWWAADLWAHRALWHFERAEMLLESTRAARRIGDLRVAGGDPASARRYYAEAISEARDLGAEREEGLAAYGMGRAELELGNVTAARKLAHIAVGLLERCGAPADEMAAAWELQGTERPIGDVS